MISILIAGMVGLAVSLFLTPVAVKNFKAWGWGQTIREEGPKAHYEKSGTPTMGGLVILAGTILGFALGHIGREGLVPFRDSGIVALGATIAFGILGFIDDFIKVRKARNLGLRSRAKFIGQAIIAIVLTYLVTEVVKVGTDVSFFRSTAIDLGIFFYIWVFILVSGSSNGVNLTDGLDGLAVGASAQVLGAFVVIAFWQFRHPGFYDIGKTGSDPFDLAILAAAMFGACVGFLWWNTAPAKIFMGDTGSLMLGGAMATFAILLNTQLLLLLLGGIFAVETLSVMMQVLFYKTLKRRVFLMAPLHHHFEVGGWPEITVMVRFWILSGLSVSFGLGLFYADFLGKGGLP
jgi:phospho-N-acetylmuramoyl-pentapeptide-transferase